MLLDRFGQSNKFWKEIYKKHCDIQVWVLCRSPRGRPNNVLGTYQIELSGMYLESQIRRSSGRHFMTSPGRQIGKSPERLNKIFSRGPGDADEDVLKTTWGPIFTDCDTKNMSIKVIQMYIMLNTSIFTYFCPNCFKFENQTLSQLKKFLKRKNQSTESPK